MKQNEPFSADLKRKAGTGNVPITAGNACMSVTFNRFCFESN